jgi:hypothetical protein
MSAITGAEAIARYRADVLAKGLELEIRGLRRRGRSCYAIIKAEYGLRGSRESVLRQFRALLDKEARAT